MNILTREFAWSGSFCQWEETVHKPQTASQALHKLQNLPPQVLIWPLASTFYWFYDLRDHLSKKKGQIPKPVHPSGLDKLHRYSFKMTKVILFKEYVMFSDFVKWVNAVSGKRSSTSSSILAGYPLTDPSTSFKVKIFAQKSTVIVFLQNFIVTGGENSFGSSSQM